MAERVVDRVLEAPPPTFTEDEAAAIALERFGVQGVARAAGSERDQTFLLEGDRPAVLKISNAAEDVARLDMEALAAQRVHALEPGLPVALPWAVPAALDPRVPAAPDPGDPAAFRTVVRSAAGSEHQARMYDRLPGHASVLGSTLSDQAMRDWGAVVARVGRALRGFTHPSAVRVMLWDPQHALRLRELLPAVRDEAVRRLVERVLDRYEAVVAPVWTRLRSQVIHTDLCSDNVLVNDRGAITGIIDFGDMSWSALIVDPATVVESHLAGRSGDELFRATRITLDGYERVTPLEPEERAIFGELVAARACASVVVPAARGGLYADAEALMAELREEAVALLTAFDATGFDEVAIRLGGRERSATMSVPELAARRSELLEPALTPLSYREPLHLVRGEGVWLWDADGHRYLDAYNNVPVVGHGHPRVTEAIARQSRLLNTNMRYLHGVALEVAERLLATTADAGLDVVLFVNSGSEANDLAWRIATAATGGTGGVSTAYAYHGISEAITALSPESTPGLRAPHVRTWDPVEPSVDGWAATLAELRDVGYPPAAAILDGVLTSDGILELDPALARELVRATHAAGALWIADEVQGGHGRTGSAMWSYQRLGIVPDLVTLGKPMGNGHPVAAVLTRRELAKRFGATTDFFSTFGGNPVAMAAARAVLDVIDDERILDRTREAGEALRAGLREAAARDGAGRVREVRGMGLATGVEIVEPGGGAPDRPTTAEIVDGMRERGVLVGTCGRHGNVVKIRPPLVFGRHEADLVVDALGEALATLG